MGHSKKRMEKKPQGKKPGKNSMDDKMSSFDGSAQEHDSDQRSHGERGRQPAGSNRK